MRDLSLIALLLIGCTTDATRRGYLQRATADLQPPPRPVVVVPGFGVTRLYDPVTGRYIWGTAHAMVQRSFADDLELPIDEDGRIGSDRLVPSGYVGSRGPVNVGWQITEALRKYGRYERDVTVFPFYYDWRLSARENARKLADFVDRIPREGRVDIVTHSAGAIVALAYLKLEGGGDEVENLVMISPTRRGVVDAFRVLVRPERFIRRVFESQVVATWPFVAELLPEDGEFLIDETGRSMDFNGWNPESWRRFGRSEPWFAESLRRARQFRDLLRDTPMPSHVRETVIAGDCVPTAVRALVRSDGGIAFYPEELRKSEKALAGTMFEPGDGTVPISSTGAAEDALILCDGHQGITTDPSVHRALIRILSQSRR